MMKQHDKERICRDICRLFHTNTLTRRNYFWRLVRKRSQHKHSKGSFTLNIHELWLRLFGGERGRRTGPEENSCGACHWSAGLNLY